LRPERRRRLGVGCALALLVAAAVLAAAARPALAASPRAPVPFHGLGAWVDIFDRHAFAHPRATAIRLARRGVRTLYVETSNSYQPRPIAHPVGLGRMLDAAHRRGLRVVGWYLPSLRSLDLDRFRLATAIRFRSPAGGRFDALAIDIEDSSVRRVERRNRRLRMLLGQIRGWLPGRPLGAIIPSPRGMQLARHYWPGFPYGSVLAKSDAVLPMDYFTYRVHGPAAVARYTARNVALLRNRDPGAVIHLIGGIAGDASRAEVRAFVSAANAAHVAGASLYDAGQTGRGAWLELARLALP
jgi:hypothetical protein